MSEPEISNESSSSPSALSWAPSTRIDKALRFLTNCLAAIGTAAILIFFGRAAELAWGGAGPFFGWLIAFAMAYVAVVLHELGHLVAARVMGMHPMSVYCGPLQGLAQRRGFRWRWKRVGRGKGVPFGAVLAFPDPRKRFGPQFLWSAAGGPIMNLAVGVLSFALAAAIPDGAGRGFVLGFGIMNVVVGLANLIPSTIGGGTDGLRVLRASRMDDSDPSLALVRLNALAVTGTTADKLPAQELEKLRALGESAESVHLWFVLKGLQNEGRWHEAAAMDAEFDRVVSRLSDAVRKGWAEHLAILDCEIRFSALLAHRTIIRSPTDALTSETDWLNPSLRPRCLAAMAAAAGSVEDSTRWLAEAEQLASNSADAAQRISEGRMRAAVESLLIPPIQAREA